MRSIVMTAGCSGCGTAAVTAAVARQLALQGKKVLLVEATAGLRRMNRLLEIREEGLFDFSDLLEGRCALENALPVSYTHLDVYKRQSVMGRNLVDGFPKEVTLTPAEIREVLSEQIGVIIDAILTTLERTPPELSADILETGITLAGGGAMLHLSLIHICRRTAICCTPIAARWR